MHEGHFQMKRSANLEKEQDVRDIVIEQVHVIVDFKMFRFNMKVLAASSEDVR